MRKTILLLFLTTILISSTIAQEKKQVIVIETDKGNIEILLYDETPLHRDNMIKLIKDHYYDGQLFHRVIENFMIQGGDPYSKDAAIGERLGTGGPGYKIPAEFRDSIFHKKGAIAAARMGDRENPKKESSGSQFYIVQGTVFTKEQLLSMQASGHHKPFTPEEIEIYTSLGGTPHLDGSYTVFGEVIKGMEVVEAIAAAETDAYDRPKENIVYKIRLK